MDGDRVLVVLLLVVVINQVSKIMMMHEATDIRAAEAVELFCYQVQKWIGSFAAALGGFDRNIGLGD